jgi:putative peptide zinc metalloprotease protein
LLFSPSLAGVLSWIVLLNLLSAGGNLYPFLKLDGYLAVMAAVDIPNLRARSMAAWWAFLLRRTRIGAPDDRESAAAAQTGSGDSRSSLPGWALAFGALSAASVPLLVAVTAAVIMNALAPGLPSLWATVIAAALLAGWAVFRAIQLVHHAFQSAVPRSF